MCIHKCIDVWQQPFQHAVKINVLRQIAIKIKLIKSFLTIL